MIIAALPVGNSVAWRSGREPTFASFERPPAHRRSEVREREEKIGI